ncbi:MAG: hypothetical protein HY308_18625 [Gammaproteobacteria bacterium]|nr:hypothetical protein [Gammaproteobacteria bacterium]
MMINEINVMSTTPPSASAAPTQPTQVVAEFDAMVWELLLRESGLMQAFESEESESMPLGDFFLQDFAHELATQVDLGFGRMALAQATETSATEVQK